MLKKLKVKEESKLTCDCMGISRDSRHKKRKTGGRMPIHKKKRAYEMVSHFPQILQLFS